MRYLGGQGEQGERWAIDDPLAQPLVRRLSTAGATSPADPLVAEAAALLDFEPVFGDLGRHAALRERVLHWYRRLAVQGTLASLR